MSDRRVTAITWLLHWSNRACQTIYDGMGAGFLRPNVWQSDHWQCSLCGGSRLCMQGLLMSAGHAALWLRGKKSDTVRQWSFLYKKRKKKKTWTSGKRGRNSALAPNANDLVRGPLAPLHPPSSSFLPCHPSPPFCSEHWGSVKSILGGTIVPRQATVKLEWLRPAQARASLFIAPGWGRGVQCCWKSCRPEGWVRDEPSLSATSFLVSVSGTAAITTRPRAL